MNWSTRYASEKNPWPCGFCGGSNHSLKTARDWTPENADDEGPGRPSVPAGTLLQPIGTNAQENWQKRRRYTIPWNSQLLPPGNPGGSNVDEQGRLVAAPAPHPDREARVKTESRCPNCKSQHKDDDHVVRFTGPHQSVESDHFPFHEGCMRTTTLMCPHMMDYGPEYQRFMSGESTPNFERGSYGELRANAIEQSQRMGFE